MNRTRLLLVLTGIFILRTVVGIAHGQAHSLLAVPLAPWQNAFVQLVIFWGPLVLMVWLWLRPMATVAWMLAGLLTAGWLFGIYFHFGPPNPDHVSSLPHLPGHDLFTWTAVALVVVEPLTAAAAAVMARALGARGETKHA